MNKVIFANILAAGGIIGLNMRRLSLPANRL
jgi:hypothetical protein